MKSWVFIVILTVGLLLFLGGRWGLKRINEDYLALEHVTHQEFAAKASSLDAVGLRIFALTNHLAFLEEYRGLLSMPAKDFNFELFVTHGRLFRLYGNLTNHSEAEKHFLSASNLSFSLNSQPLKKADLATNSVFDVRMD